MEIPESTDFDLDIDVRVKDKIIELIGKEVEIEEDTELITLGLDSMMTVGLIVELEEEFGIAFDDDELLTEYFSSVNAISERVKAKLLTNTVVNN